MNNQSYFKWLFSVEHKHSLQKNAQNPYYSTLDKQRICVNTQLKSSKKQLKWNVCVPKGNSNDRYAITCNVIAYHLVHFFSIWVINKCQSGIDYFFYQRALNITPVLWNIGAQSRISRRNTGMKVKLLQSVHARMSTRGWDLLQVQ